MSERLSLEELRAWLDRKPPAPENYVYLTIGDGRSMDLRDWYEFLAPELETLPRRELLEAGHA